MVQPRRFEFEDLEAMPQYWFAGNPILTHLENTFSILIPPGERFFIRSVRHYAMQVRDADEAELIRAFVQQEALHTRAHNELNTSFRRFGVNVERENAYAERLFGRLERALPPKMRLGVTAFAEHLTATAAHLMFLEPAFEKWLHPQMLQFWRWHAAEELEHKAVAFDLFHAVGGTYLLRVLSAATAAAALAIPYARITARMMRDDPHRPTRSERRQARRVHRRLLPPQLRLVLAYFRPSFHPWDAHDEPHLREWYASEDAA